MHTTVALSENGATNLLRGLLGGQAHGTSGSNSWGPFRMDYSANVQLSGGTIEIVDSPRDIFRVWNINAAGQIGLALIFNLGAILPRICIPPFQACVDIPFIGRVCTPQVCVTWPSVTVPINLPYTLNISADFDVEVSQRGSFWDVNLLVYPLSLQVDLSPNAGVLVDTVRRYVRSVLEDIPLIGNLIAGLVDTVLGALSGLVSTIFSVLNQVVHKLILLLDI